ncbi:MAG: hypothetical protein M3Y77_06205 [Actinomycetota bacterium]|nr:hypothetical protein [Actinomycetota bacterium]
MSAAVSAVAAAPDPDEAIELAPLEAPDIAELAPLEAPDIAEAAALEAPDMAELAPDLAELAAELATEPAPPPALELVGVLELPHALSTSRQAAPPASSPTRRPRRDEDETVTMNSRKTSGRPGRVERAHRVGVCSHPATQ